MPDQRDDVLNFIKYNGPVLPVQVAKHINTNILFSSAILSELVARKILRITHASIGGSPIYYLAGQEELMDSKLSTALHGKEKEAYQLLKDKKVLWEKEMEPWQRVAVKDLKDFAVQIIANQEGNTESFWKHKLISDEEAKIIISEILNGMQPIVNVEQEEINNNLQTEEKEPLQEKLREETNEIAVSEIIRPDNTNKIKDFVQEKILEQKQSKSKESKKEPKLVTNFYNKILDFIKVNNVEVIKEEVIKKEKEFDFIVNIPSSFGNLRYLIKAKNKSLINEADISIAFSEGQLKKIPVILLTNGKPNKKAILMIDQKMLGQLVLKEI